MLGRGRRHGVSHAWVLGTSQSRATAAAHAHGEGEGKGADVARCHRSPALEAALDGLLHTAFAQMSSRRHSTQTSAMLKAPDGEYWWALLSHTSAGAVQEAGWQGATRWLCGTALDAVTTHSTEFEWG